MGRESIEEGELSSPLVPKEKHEVYAGISGGGGGGEQSGSSSATVAVVLTTLVAVSGSYVFGSAVSTLRCVRCHSYFFCKFTDINSRAVQVFKDRFTNFLVRIDEKRE